MGRVSHRGTEEATAEKRQRKAGESIMITMILRMGKAGRQPNFDGRKVDAGAKG
jgi:hypothetical protein